MWPFNIGDCLIEVSTEASLTVFEIMFMFKFQNEPAVMMRINEWVSDYCVMPREQFFQLYHGKNKIHFEEIMIMMMSALYKTNMISWIFTVLTHWNNSCGQTWHSTRTYYPDSWPTSLSSYTLMLQNQQIPIA